MADQAGKTAGQGFASNLAKNASSTLTSTGDRIVGALGTAFKVGAAAVAGGIVTSIGLGLKRLVGIEEAQAKLRGLGHDAGTVDTIMGNALDSVRGTAFGLADAATLAATAVAAGVQPGEDLERTLRLTGDAATIAGTDLGEMGDIFGKVAAGNRMMTQELNQLTQRGVPMLQWLAEEFGVTAEEAREMVSRGEVDFATFQEVIEKNIGGAALESGKTTMGAFRNMGAAAGRLGATLIGPVFTQARGFFTGVIGWLDGLTDAAGPFAERLGNQIAGAMERVAEVGRTVALGVSALVAAFREGDVTSDGFVGVMERIGNVARNVSQFISQNREAVQRLMEAVGPAVGIIAGLATTFSLVSKAMLLVTAATPIGIILALTTALVYAWQNSETFRNVVTGAFEAVKAVVGPVIDTVVGLVRGFGDSSSETAGRLSGIWDRIVGIFGSAFELIGTIISGALAVFQAFWTSHGETIVSFISSTFDNILTVVDGVLSVIQGIIDTVLGVITGDWTRAWNGIKNILSGVWNIIRGVVSQALNVVRTLLSAALSNIRALWSTAWNAVKSVLSSAWTSMREAVSTGIAAVVEFVRGLPSRAVSALSSLGSNLSSSASSAWREFRRATVERVADLIQYVRDLPSRIITALGNVGNLLKSAGKDMIRGLINGIKDMAGAAANAAKDAVKGAVDSAKNFLRIGSPSKVFMEIGQDSGEGLVIGLERMLREVAASGAALAGAAVAEPGRLSGPALAGGPAVGRLRAAQVSAPAGGFPSSMVAVLDVPELGGRLDARIEFKQSEVASTRYRRMHQQGVR